MKSKLPDLGKLRSKLPETPEKLKSMNKQFQLWKQKYFGIQPSATQDKQGDANLMTTLSILIVCLSLLSLILERDYFSLIPKK